MLRKVLGKIVPKDLGTGTPSASNFLRGDRTWAVPGGTLTSGEYTPTLYNTANLDASTAYKCQWMRVGNVVHVSGKVDVNPTAGGVSTQLGISLPVASNFDQEENCAGTAFAIAVAGQGAAILAETTNDRAFLMFVSADTSNRAMFFTFTYLVI
jgi:hypothetical protein